METVPLAPEWRTKVTPTGASAAAGATGATAGQICLYVSLGLFGTALLGTGITLGTMGLAGVFDASNPVYTRIPVGDGCNSLGCTKVETEEECYAAAAALNTHLIDYIKYFNDIETRFPDEDDDDTVPLYLESNPPAAPPPPMSPHCLYLDVVQEGHDYGSWFFDWSVKPLMFANTVNSCEDSGGIGGGTGCVCKCPTVLDGALLDSPPPPTPPSPPAAPPFPPGGSMIKTFASGVDCESNGCTPLTTKADCASWHVSSNTINGSAEDWAWSWETFNLPNWIDGYRALAPIGCFKEYPIYDYSTLGVYNRSSTHFNDCDSTCKEALLATNPLDRDGTVVHISDGPLGGCGEGYTIESSDALTSVKFECVCRCADAP